MVTRGYMNWILVTSAFSTRNQGHCSAPNQGAASGTPEDITSIVLVFAPALEAKFQSETLADSDGDFGLCVMLPHLMGSISGLKDVYPHVPISP